MMKNTLKIGVVLLVLLSILSSVYAAPCTPETISKLVDKTIEANPELKNTPRDVLETVAREALARQATSLESVVTNLVKVGLDNYDPTNQISKDAAKGVSALEQIALEQGKPVADVLSQYDALDPAVKMQRLVELGKTTELMQKNNIKFDTHDVLYKGLTNPELQKLQHIEDITKILFADGLQSPDPTKISPLDMAQHVRSGGADGIISTTSDMDIAKIYGGSIGFGGERNIVLQLAPKSGSTVDMLSDGVKDAMLKSPEFADFYSTYDNAVYRDKEVGWLKEIKPEDIQGVWVTGYGYSTDPANPTWIPNPNFGKVSPAEISVAKSAEPSKVSASVKSKSIPTKVFEFVSSWFKSDTKLQTQIPDIPTIKIEPGKKAIEEVSEFKDPDILYPEIIPPEKPSGQTGILDSAVPDELALDSSVFEETSLPKIAALGDVVEPPIAPKSTADLIGLENQLSLEAKNILDSNIAC